MNGGASRKTWATLLALVVTTPLAFAFGLGAPQANQPSAAPVLPSAAPVEAAPPAKPETPWTTAPPEYCVERLLGPVAAMAGVLPRQVTSAPADHEPRADWLDRMGRGAEALAKVFGEDGRPAAFSQIIATIPDPVDSGLDYEFETALHAVWRGMEEPLGKQVFYRDRSWLPWDDRQGSVDQQHESERCRLSTPGVVLFRGSGEARGSVSVLWLVGESPTSGLRQAALHSALGLAQRFRAAGGTPPPGAAAEPVRIVGPTFSGSAQSLRLALREAASELPAPLDFRVISGTATGSEVPHWLGGDGEALTQPPLSSRISFAATTVPEATIECAYLWFLKNRFGVDTEPALDGPGAEAQGPERLQGVATLSESGTEFGATSGSEGSPPGATEAAKPPSRAAGCRWAPGSAFSFPYHISALRDAYEALDHRDEQGRKDASIARATSLDASLRERRVPLELEANPSEKTKTAQDITLGNVLTQISRREVRYVAIHATDVGDAIFLARRIRDVAPDVRLAFFDSDALLLHSAYRRDLVGSLVVSAYPFLGVNEFASRARAPLTFLGFESGVEQGLYNAVLAQRQAPLDALSNYVFDPKNPTVLPIWISALGQGQFVPTQVRPTADCAGTLYRAKQPNPGRALCGASGGPRGSAWAAFDRLRVADIEIEPHLSMPRVWDFLFAVLVLAFGLDVARQNKAFRRFSSDSMPDHVFSGNDQQIDRAIGRTKWRLYATIRTFLFCLVFTYMGGVYCLSFVARGGFDLAGGLSVRLALQLFCALVIVVAFVASTERTLRAAARFGGDYRRFATCVGANVLPWTWDDWIDSLRSGATPRGKLASAVAQESAAEEAPEARRGESGGRSSRPAQPRASSRPPLLDRISLGFGVARPVGRLDVARTSFAQLRLITVVSVALTAAFTTFLLVDTLKSADWFASDWGNLAVPALSLMVLRNTPLTNGVSASTPALLCMACVYTWAVGRMARLSLAHATSRVSPPDGEADLVSTPIRFILHPNYRRGTASDEGFTDIERDVQNAIWRPITGRYYVIASLTIAFFPLVLFALKPLSTLEGPWGTRLLGGGLALSVFLIGVTLVQLVQYWVVLERLLKRTMEHPLGPAFRSVPAFARDSVDHQVSRSPHELLRWTGCARQFCQLVAMSDPLADLHELAEKRTVLQGAASELRSLRIAALDTPRERNLEGDAGSGAVGSKGPGCEEIALVEGIILAASSVTELLEQAWDQGAEARAAAAASRVARDSGRLAVGALPVNAVGADWTHASTTLGGSERASVPQDSWPAASLAERARSSGPAPVERAPSKPKHTDSKSAEDGLADALSPMSFRYSTDELAWLRSAQTFVATVVTLLIHRHVRQFRYFLSVLTACALLLLLAVTSYPFEPYRLLLTFIWVVMGSVVAAGLAIFIQMDRNTLMSHIAGTSPNELTLDSAFALRLFAWAVVPLLSVAAAQYPEVANLLVGIFGPFLRALR